MRPPPDRSGPRRALPVLLALLLPVLAGGAAALPDPGTGSAVSAASLAQPADRQLLLRLQATEGESATYRYETRASLTPPPGMGAPTNVATTMVLRRTVESATPDSLRYRARIEDFGIEVSSQDDATSRQLEQVADRARENAVGSRFWMTVTRRGEMVRLRRGDGETVGGSGVEQALRQVSFPTLPPGPVAVGESWRSVDSLDASSFGAPIAGTILAETRATLDSVDRTGERPVAVLRVEGSYELRPDTAAAGMITGEMRGSSTGTARFDVEAGRFLTSEGTRDVTFDLSAPGARSREGGGSFTVQSSVRHSARLAEDG